MKQNNDRKGGSFITLEEMKGQTENFQIEEGEKRPDEGFYVVGGQTDLVQQKADPESDWQRKTRGSIERLLKDMNLHAQHIEMSPVTDLYLFRVVGSARFSVRISTQAKLGTCLILLYLPVETMPQFQSLLMLKLCEFNEKLPFGKYVYRHDSGEVILSYQCVNRDGIEYGQIKPILPLLVNDLISHEDEILRYARGVFTGEEKINLLMGLTQQIRDLTTDEKK